jgi:phosphatidylserine/phosphatidylglycerophosphate/cardiolipin synthase-like enzyme
MKPLLPQLNSPAVAARGNSFDDPTFLSLFDGAMSSDQRRKPLPLHAPGGPHYDPDIATEIRRMQDVLAPLPGETRVEAITRHLNLATKLSQSGVNSEIPLDEEMTPMIPHRPHKSFPIALVNRRPWGTLNHQGVNVPQNEAWLSAIRNATSSVFIQSPNLNASPLIPALKEALERGVEVTYYVCLGYNDAGELLPFQGGTNEMVADHLYESLDKASKQHLNVHYYVAKDQIAPIHNSFKKRSCHIKLLIADGHVGIQGNGNQDTQSWFHSMEVNIMIDSEQICGEWRDAIERNQSMFALLFFLQNPDSRQRRYASVWTRVTE